MKYINIPRYRYVFNYLMRIFSTGFLSTVQQLISDHSLKSGALRSFSLVLPAATFSAGFFSDF